MSEFGKKIRKKIRRSTGQDEPYTRSEGEEKKYDDELDKIQKAETYEEKMKRIGEDVRGKTMPADKEEEKDPEGPMRRLFKKMGWKL